MAATVLALSTLAATVAGMMIGREWCRDRKIEAAVAKSGTQRAWMRSMGWNTGKV